MANQTLFDWVPTLPASGLQPTDQLPIVQPSVQSESVTIAALQALFGAPWHPGYVVGNWYPTVFSSVGLGQSLAANTAYLTPFMVAQTVSIDEIAGRIRTASAAGNFQLAIFGSNANHQPSGLPLAYTVATLSTGSAGNISATLNVTLQLEPGQLYWACVAADNTTVVFQTNTLDAPVLTFVAGLSSLAFSVNNSIGTSFTYAHTFANGLDTLNISPASLGTINGGRVPALILLIASVP